MTAPMADFQLVQPHSVSDAIAARCQHAGSRFIAGGPDILVNLRRGIGPTDLLIDLSGIDELSDIKSGKDGLRIGAGVNVATVAAHPAVLADYRALAEAAVAIGAPAHRIMGTVGGNLCLDTRCIYYNQSE